MVHSYSPSIDARSSPASPPLPSQAAMLRWPGKESKCLQPRTQETARLQFRDIIRPTAAIPEDEPAKPVDTARTVPPATL